MERRAVESSAIASVGYDAAAGTLEIEFRSGRIYQYFDVPPHIAQEMVSAPSRGAYLNDVVKRLGYRYQRLL
jgi:hypothetical protein